MCRMDEWIRVKQYAPPQLSDVGHKNGGKELTSTEISISSMFHGTTLKLLSEYEKLTHFFVNVAQVKNLQSDIHKIYRAHNKVS